jgi:Fe-S cluster assembly iron-binding protein IscA
MPVSHHPSITLSDEASARLRGEVGVRLLRIAFTTGCGGSGYRLSFEDAAQDGDAVIESAGVRVALDDMAATKLDGAVILYSEEEDGYTLDHPDAVTAVWCG